MNQTPVNSDAAYRLPRTVTPMRYELTITPDLGAATFAGEEAVSLQIHQPITEVVLNAAELQIATASLTTPDGSAHQLAVAMNEPDEQVVLRLPTEVPPGPATLRLRFSGTLNDKLRGFYRSTFDDPAGGTQVIATTQFESTDARRAFPCWDEPDRKAVFSVTLVVDEGLAAISNAAVASESRVGESPAGEGKRRVRFADTMPMSTYLVAMVVGPLEATEAIDVDGVPLRVVHVPGKAHLCDFALEVGAHALRFFSAWFAIAYPADKLDLIALPDFAAGAMENLGAVTFREQVLLIDPAAASRAELERVADVVSHEIAHMWFGDLVTMRWWNGLWLNEAFATFMELLCVDAFRPEWQRWVTFGLSRGTAMETDGLASTRPIEFPVGRPAEAEGMFDILTYEKGAAVLRMLERYLGAEPFRRGISHYLDAHRHANAETTDLWDAIETVTGEPVRATMDSWIFQGGHPLVQVSASGNRRALALDQRPFRYRPEAAERGAIGADWQVPVMLRAGIEGAGIEGAGIEGAGIEGAGIEGAGGGGPGGSDGAGSGEHVEHHRVLLAAGGSRVDLGGRVRWVVVNEGGWGFYRSHQYGGLAEALPHRLGDLDPLERFNLVSDTWAEVLAGTQALPAFLALVGRLTDESDPSVWGVVVGALALLDRVAGHQSREMLQSFARARLRPALERVGWTARSGEGERTGTLRATLLDALGTLADDAVVIEWARRIHAEAVAGKDTIEADLTGAVVAVVAVNGGEADFEAFLERYRHPANPQEETRYLYGLARFREPDLVARALELARTEARTQNAPFMINLVLVNREGGPAAWEFVKAHWDELLARFPRNTIPRMLSGVSGLCRPSLAADVRAFLGDHPVPSGGRTVEQSLERLEVNLAFAQRDGPRLAEALEAAL